MSKNAKASKGIFGNIFTPSVKCDQDSNLQPPASKAYLWTTGLFRPIIEDLFCHKCLLKYERQNYVKSCGDLNHLNLSCIKAIQYLSWFHAISNNVAF